MQFYLAGESPSASREVDVDANGSLYDLKDLVAAHFAIVEPQGVTFGNDQGALSTLQEIVASTGPVSISIDGRTVRDAPGPKGLPFIGNHFDVFPDHLGNHQRLFEHYGPVIKTESLGRTTYLTNDPVIAGIAFAESDFFTKAINKAHPLYPIKNKAAGVFLGDTDTEEWRVAHKFLPPALGPKAVRHYAPTMQKTVEDAFSVFDELDDKGQAWNVYQYMLKLGSQAVGKLVLGMDFNHFTSPSAHPAEMVRVIAETLELNKKIASKGDWYSKLPFWEPKKLQVLTDRMYELVNEVISKAESSGVHDLPLQDAALEASNMIDYAIRATDSKGDKLPKTSLVQALVVATGAGFTTTSSLLSWLIYGLVTYPGMQERLLQELIDNGIDENTQFNADVTDKLSFLDKYIKETQRRHNPSFQPGRTAKTDLVLPGGYKIPKDAIVIPAIHHIHNNPNLWDNPNSFDPDRWDSEQVKNRPKNSYIPFATGQRMCIGFNFALQEVKIFLPKLVYRYKFMPEEVGATEYDPMFQLIRPVNLYVRAEKRVKWPPRSDA